jgi:hypothetical protein
MKSLYVLFIFFTLSLFSQETIETTFISKTKLKAQSIIAIDDFETLYYVEGNSLYKKNTDKTISYSNVHLGTMTSVNTFNTLKINVFYKNFNTVIILDNRLTELFKIDFNTSQTYKNVSHVSTGYDNTFWVFNQDLQQLELFDYKTNKVRATTMPVQSNVLDLKSNYNYCWLLTEKHLYTYNYFGSVISKIKNDGFTALAEDNENLIIKQGGKLFFKPKNSETILPIKTSEVLINQFLLTNETMYIYDNEMLHEFQLKIK